MFSKRKRLVLTIKDKLKILKKIDSGKSTAEIVSEYGIGKSTIFDLKKKREKMQSFLSKSFSEDVGSYRKTLKTTSDVPLEAILLKWFKRQMSIGKIVTGSEIKIAAKKLAERLGRNGFVASEGWLWRFRNRHGILLKNKLVSIKSEKNNKGTIYDEDEGDCSDTEVETRLIHPMEIKVEPLPVCEEERDDSVSCDESTSETEDPLSIDDPIIKERCLVVKSYRCPSTESINRKSLTVVTGKRNITSSDTLDDRKRKILKAQDNNDFLNAIVRSGNCEKSDEDELFLMSLLPSIKQLTKSQKDEFKEIVLRELKRLKNKKTICTNSTKVVNSPINIAETISGTDDSNIKNLNNPSQFIKIDSAKHDENINMNVSTKHNFLKTTRSVRGKSSLCKMTLPLGTDQPTPQKMAFSDLDKISKSTRVKKTISKNSEKPKSKIVSSGENASGDISSPTAIFPKLIASSDIPVHLVTNSPLLTNLKTEELSTPSINIQSCYVISGTGTSPRTSQWQITSTGIMPKKFSSGQQLSNNQTSLTSIDPTRIKSEIDMCEETDLSDDLELQTVNSNEEKLSNRALERTQMETVPCINDDITVDEMKLEPIDDEEEEDPFGDIGD